MEDVTSPKSSSEETEMGRGALIGVRAESAGCGKEVVIYSNPPVPDSCKEVLPVGGDNASQSVIVELSWDDDWAWSVHGVLFHALGSNLYGTSSGRVVSRARPSTTKVSGDLCIHVWCLYPRLNKAN